MHAQAQVNVPAYLHPHAHTHTHTHTRCSPVYAKTIVVTLFTGNACFWTNYLVLLSQKMDKHGCNAKSRIENRDGTCLVQILLSHTFFTTIIVFREAKNYSSCFFSPKNKQSVRATSSDCALVWWNRSLLRWFYDCGCFLISVGFLASHSQST